MVFVKAENREEYMLNAHSHHEDDLRCITCITPNSYSFTVIHSRIHVLTHSLTHSFTHLGLETLKCHHVEFDSEKPGLAYVE